MARIRTIKPEFFRHKKLFDLERSSKLPLRVAFAGLFTVADRDGRFKLDVDALKLDCLPWDDVDFGKVLASLAQGSFIQVYSFEEKQYACIPSWDAHQVIGPKEMKSKLPVPPKVNQESKEVTGSFQQLPEVSTNSQDGTGTGRELEKERKGIKTSSADADPDFMKFWWAYPRSRRQAKPDTFKAWQKEKPPIEAVLKALEWQRKDAELSKENFKFMKLSAGYIRGRRWEDEPPYQARPVEKIIPKTLGDHFKVGF